MSKTLQTVLSALLCAVLLFGSAVPALAAEETESNVTAVTMEDVTLYRWTWRYQTAMLHPVIMVDMDGRYTFTFESSKPAVATVDGAGIVTARRIGKATVTCTVTDEYGNAVSGSCTVTVRFSIWRTLIDLLIPPIGPLFSEFG